MNIFDLVQAKEIATYYTSNPSAQMTYLGETLFPAKKRLGLDLSWIKGSKGLPVALRPSALDSKATLRERIGVQKIETEMPFFREAMRIGEKDRQELNKVAGAGNSALIMPILNQIFDDVSELVEGSRVQAERMRMQLLSTGKIAVTDNRQVLDYDYGHPSGNKETLTGTAMWSDTTDSNPIADILRWQDAVEEATGVRPQQAMCTRKTWNYLIANAKIRLDLNPVGGSNIIMTDSMMKSYLDQKLGIQIAVYNKKFKTEGGSASQFFPDEVFTLIPTGNLGNTYYGTTPEESDLMTGSSTAQVSIVNTGVAVTTLKEAHPVNVQTIVSAIMLPSFESIDSVFIATVHA